MDRNTSDRIAGKLSAALQVRNLRIMISNPAFMGSPHLHGFRVCPSSLKPKTMRQRLEILGEELAQATLNLAVLEFSH
jgi:hypothetical protein